MRRKLFHEEANYRVKGQNLLSLVNPAAMISLVHFNLFQMPLSISGTFLSTNHLPMILPDRFVDRSK